MMRLGQSPDIFFSLTMLLQFLLCLGAIYCFIKACRQRMSAKRLLLFVGNLGLQYFAIQLLLEGFSAALFGRSAAPVARAVERVPLAAIGLWLMLWAVLTGMAMRRLNRYDRQHVTLQVIKASLDDLPTGLCFGREDGSVILSNRRMEELCLRLTGGSVLNAGHLWQAIQAAGENPQADGSVILHAGDTVWSVSRCRLTTDIGPVWEISAADVSEEYRLIRALEQDNRRLKENGRRLREYGRNVERLTTENEILDTKIYIHSETGNLLYAAVHSMTENATAADREQTLRRWRQTNRLLQTDTAMRESSSFDDLGDTAQAIGVTLVLDGTLPEEKAAAHLCEAIAHECLTNTVRHAQGNRVVLTVQEGENAYLVRCTNNGIVPTEPVHEGGGLSSLRRRLERCGGTMQIESRPVFCLTATIPKGDNDG